MQIGINLPVMVPGLDRDAFFSWCQRIDSGFFSSLAAGERVAFHNPDLSAALAAAAILTERVKIVSNVFVPLLHHPVMLAKQLATLDTLSGGRIVAGVGVGGREQDYQAAGVAMGNRLTRLRQSVEAMRRVWNEDTIVPGTQPVGPATLQERGPKVWAGSITPDAIRVCARWADGLAGFCFGPSELEMATQFEAARQGWSAHGRPTPWLATGFWYALGPNAREQLDSYLDRYLNFMAPQARSQVRAICKVTSDQSLKDAIQRADDLGADEVLLVPTTVDPDDVHRVADLLS